MQTDLLASVLHRGADTLHPLPPSTTQNQNSGATRRAKALTLETPHSSGGIPQPSENCCCLPLPRASEGCWEVPGLTGLLHRDPPAQPGVTADLCRNVPLSHPRVSSQSLKMASKFAQMVLNPGLDNGRLGFYRTITK